MDMKIRLRIRQKLRFGQRENYNLLRSVTCYAVSLKRAASIDVLFAGVQSSLRLIRILLILISQESYVNTVDETDAFKMFRIIDANIREIQLNAQSCFYPFVLELIESYKGAFFGFTMCTSYE